MRSKARTDELAKWWSIYRTRSVNALATALGISRDEVLARLGIASLRDVAIPMPRPAPPKVAKPLGRPRREDIDRGELVRALQEESGSVRAVARKLGLPRNTRRSERRSAEVWPRLPTRSTSPRRSACSMHTPQPP